jgi:hypothetical protein
MKIAICSPVYSTVTMNYAHSLVTMVHWTDQAEIVFNGKPARPAIEVFMDQSSVLPQIRNRLVRSAVEWGANYLLWIDSDISFPKESLLRLLSLNLPVVGVNYPRRGPGIRPTAIGLNGQDVFTTQQLANALTVEPVTSLGLGLCLIDMRVIHKLKGKPFFALEMLGDDGTEFKGEDYFFFERIRKAGFTIHLDHHLSWDIGHVAQRTLKNSHGG